MPEGSRQPGTSSRVDKSSPSLTINVSLAAPGWLAQSTRASARFSTPIKLRRFCVSGSGSGIPRSTNLINRKKFARTPGPYTNGGRIIAISTRCSRQPNAGLPRPPTSRQRRDPEGQEDLPP